MKCDIAPSRFERFAGDGYFTIDAPWIVPALIRTIPIEGPIYEPAAGRGHLVVELRRLGFEVKAADLHAHKDPLVSDIAAGADIFELKSLKRYRSVVTNLPYASQDLMLKHLLPIAAPDRCRVATLARAEWISAKEPRALVHDNPWLPAKCDSSGVRFGFVRSSPVRAIVILGTSGRPIHAPADRTLSFASQATKKRVRARGGQARLLAGAPPWPVRL